MNITLAGSLGSGKSSVGKRLAKLLDVEFISTGQIFRSIGQASDLGVLQTNIAAETNTSIDDEVDGYVADRASRPEPFVMDSRMAWHFAPVSLKVYLYVSSITAAERVLKDTSRNAESYDSLKDAEKSLAQRRKSEVTRYMRLYGVKINDWANFDIVVLTDGAEIDQVVDLIMKRLKNDAPKLWISKRHLVPMMSIRDLSGLTRGDLIDESRLDPISLVLEGKYGFVYEDPLLLASWLNSSSDFVAIHKERPSYLDRDYSCSREAAELNKSWLYDWEEVGSCELNFKNEL